MDHEIIPIETIKNKIYYLRGHKVMLDTDLAELYGVETYRLNESVKRNINRFPSDFMFQLTKEEWKVLTSQFARSKAGKGGRRTLPFAFTENGVAMLSSILNSEQAIFINIQIMRAFTHMREMLITHIELSKKIDELEKKYEVHDEQLQIVFMALKQLIAAPEEPEPEPEEKRKVGF